MWSVFVCIHMAFMTVPKNHSIVGKVLKLKFILKKVWWEITSARRCLEIKLHQNSLRFFFTYIVLNHIRSFIKQNI